MTVSFVGCSPSNFTVGRHGQQITHIVIHAMIGTMVGTLATFKNPREEVSAHYGIGRDGSVVQYVKDSDKAWHVCDANAFCLGIEHEDLFELNGELVGGGDNVNRTVEWWTGIQLKNSVQLVVEKMKQYSVPLENVIGHNDKFLIPYRNSHQDPGVLFPWGQYRDMILAARL